MRHKWKAWNDSWDHENSSPYVDWLAARRNFKQLKRNDLEFYFDEQRQIEVHSQSFAVIKSSFEQFVQFAKSEPDTLDVRTQALLPRGAGRAFRRDFGGDTTARLPMPKSTVQECFDEDLWSRQDPDQLPAPPPIGSVVLGAIDTGIALGHRRFQHKDGTTRILAAWQQNAPAHPNQCHLPFGREYYAPEINALLNKHWPRRPIGAFDEDAFNHDTGVLGMREIHGHREVAMRAAHGTHVLDLAAGADPDNPDNLLTHKLEKMPIIAVNLPTRQVLGLSGTFLEYYVIFAASRIVTLADALWLKAVAQSPALESIDGKRGYRIVINLSFGKSAGSPDGDSAFHDYIARLNEEREVEGFHPVEFIMPAGNDNLKRCHASVELKNKTPAAIRWRIKPEDRSCNYLEIWSDTFDPDDGASVAKKFKIGIAPPGHPELPLTACENGAMLELGDFVARVYCREKKRSDGKVRVHILLCTAPTYSVSPDEVTAPAGVWLITVKDDSSKNRTVLFGVQTDQSARVSSATGLRSYLDDDDYERFDKKGRLADTFSFEPGEPREDQDAGSKVRRHGTMNALAGFDDIAAIGGYRLSDGKPAAYSGTGVGHRISHKSKGAPTMAMPSDDSFAHRGQLAAGSRDGSAIAMSGTSAATALATRHVIWSYLNSRSAASRSPRAILYKDADSTDEGKVEFPKEVDIEKIGGGRLTPPIARDSQKLRRSFTTRAQYFKKSNTG